jgi:hypothetical protein
MIEARISQYEAVVSIPPVTGFTAVEEPKPESRVVVRHDPIYKITEMTDD